MKVGRGSDVAAAIECARVALTSGPSATGTFGDQLVASDVAGTIIRHRLSRLVVDAGDRFPLDADTKERITLDALAHTRAAMELIGSTIDVVDMLRAAGVKHLVFKGVALGALSQTPAGRGAGDVDILVTPSDVPLVHRVFVQNGVRPVLAQPDVLAPGSWRVWQFVEREAPYRRGSTTVDMHWRISSQHQLFPTWDALYARRTVVDVAGSGIPTLSMADSLAAACYHSYFDQFQPVRSLVDVLMLITRVDATALPGDLPRRLRSLMAGVVSLVAEVFPGVVDDEVSQLLDVLPTPAAIVRRRFRDALESARVRWEDNPDGGALLSKLVAEARFDNPLYVLPRFIGKRLLYFPPWTPERPTTSLLAALSGRVALERARWWSHRGYPRTPAR